MTDPTSKCFARRASRLLTVLVLGAALAACGKSDSSGGSAAAPAKVDACALVTHAMIAAYASGLGKGEPGKIPKQSSVSTCIWADAHHIPGLILNVGPADPSGVVKGLEGELAKMGYRVVAVSGLGDEAAVAIQQADPKLPTKTGIAVLSVRVGKRQFAYSPLRPEIPGTGSPVFERLRQLSAATVKRLASQ
jgi:hypothetical protein